MGRLERLAELFKYFNDPTRLNILDALMAKEMCVGDLCSKLNMTQSAISHQLRTLKQGDLVKDRKEGKNVFYSIKDDCVKSIISIGLEHIEGR